MRVLLILSPMTNLIITASFVVEFYFSTLFQKKKCPYSFPKSFIICYLVNSKLEQNFSVPFYQFTTQNLLFLIFSFIFNGPVNFRYLLSSSDRLKMTLRNNFDMNGTWFARRSFFLRILTGKKHRQIKL